ncbi:MAG TPA: hypothetical protein DIT67_09505 [Octadecabacter sp.]|nr:hypothetical protein [Octadecabacter sp.]
MSKLGNNTVARRSIATTTLVVGATGATGSLLLEQLLFAGGQVRAIARSPEKLKDEVRSHPNMKVIRASVLDIPDAEMREHVRGCSAVVSCLGHVMDFKGVYGAPKLLCTDAVCHLCRAIEGNAPADPVRFILMNTVGAANPDIDAQRTLFDRVVLALLRRAIPPHRDNENALQHLHQDVGTSNQYIEWCAVRPDSLTNSEVSQYEILPSPVTGIFSGRPTARANVAHFMAALVSGTALWQQWKFQTPVVMNAIEQN